MNATYTKLVITRKAGEKVYYINGRRVSKEIGIEANDKIFQDEIPGQIWVGKDGSNGKPNYDNIDDFR